METPTRTSPAVVPFLSGMVGAALGGALGCLAFGWLLRQGLYALALPGALLGLGGGLLARQRSVPLAVVCGLAALALGIFLEWRWQPFIKDDSLAYFLTHLHQLRGVSWIMILLGTGAGFWFGLGRPRPAEVP